MAGGFSFLFDGDATRAICSYGRDELLVALVRQMRRHHEERMNYPRNPKQEGQEEVEDRLHRFPAEQDCEGRD